MARSRTTTVLASVRKELRDRRATDTALGRAAENLARRLDDDATPPSTITGLARELRMTMADVRDTYALIAARQPDPPSGGDDDGRETPANVSRLEEIRRRHAERGA